MKKTVLLYNGVSTTFADLDDDPCLSLMALSAYLKQIGYCVEVVHDRHTDNELRLLLQDCTMVGFSVYTGTGLMRTVKMAKRIRHLAPDIPLTWGGYHPTLEPRQVLDSPYADFVVRGEGEFTLEELLKCLQEGKPEGALAQIKGLSFRKKNGEVVNNPARISGNINEFPMLDYDLYDNYFRKKTAVQYMTSRGCPFDCRFCSSTAFNHLHGARFRQLSLARIFQDIDILIKRYNPKMIEFLDDNFLSSVMMIKGFIEGYRQRDYQFTWMARSRCDLFAGLDDSVIKELRDIGLLKVDFGVESGSQRILDFLRKRLQLPDVMTTINKMARNGLWAFCTFINGVPGETLEEVYASIRLRNEIKRVSPRSKIDFYVLTPFPGTELLKDCYEYGFQLPDSIEEYIDFNQRQFKAPWMTRKHQHIVTAISWASFVDMYDPEPKSPWWFKALFGVFKADANWRFQHCAFRFAPEFLIADWIYEKKSRSYRKNTGVGQDVLQT